MAVGFQDTFYWICNFVIATISYYSEELAVYMLMCQKCMGKPWNIVLLCFQYYPGRPVTRGLGDEIHGGGGEILCGSQHPDHYIPGSPRWTSQRVSLLVGASGMQHPPPIPPHPTLHSHLKWPWQLSRDSLLLGLWHNANLKQWNLRFGSHCKIKPVKGIFIAWDGKSAGCERSWQGRNFA